MKTTPGSLKQEKKILISLKFFYITFTLDESFKNGVVFVLNKLCNCTSATVGNWCCKLLWRLTCSYLCIPFIVNLMLNIDGCWYYSHQSLLVQIILSRICHQVLKVIEAWSWKLNFACYIQGVSVELCSLQKIQ